MSIGAINNSIPNANLTTGKVDGRQNQLAVAKDKEEQSRQSVADRDEYIPGDGKDEKSLGIYRVEADEKGNKKIVFDRPDSTEKSKQTNVAEETGESPIVEQSPRNGGVNQKKEEKPEKSGGATVNTDKVDAEIKRLQEKKQQLEQRMNGVRDNPEKRKDLEQQLSQIDAELSHKRQRRI